MGWQEEEEDDDGDGGGGLAGGGCLRSSGSKLLCLIDGQTGLLKGQGCAVNI